MALAINIASKKMQKLQKQIPTITREDLITSLNIIHLSCTSFNAMKEMINDITISFEETGVKIDSQLFKTNFEFFLDFLDKKNLELLTTLIRDVSIINIFNSPLLLFEFLNFSKRSITNIEFIKEKLIKIKNDNLIFIKKINSCKEFGKLKVQLNDNLQILKHFKSIVENEHLSLLIPYNFIANQLSYFVNNYEYNNIYDDKIFIDLTENEIQQFQQIISRENKFQDVLVVIEGGSSTKYMLNLKKIILILKIELLNLFEEYHSHFLKFKKNKDKMLGFQIKAIKLKIQNILDLSNHLFNVLWKPVEHLPLTKITNKVLSNSTNTNEQGILSEFSENIDNNIAMIKKIEAKINNAMSLQSDLLLVNAGVDNNIKSIKKMKTKKRSKQQKNSKKIDANIVPISATIVASTSSGINVENINKDNNLFNNNIKEFQAEITSQEQSIETNVKEVKELTVKLQQISKKINKVRTTEIASAVSEINDQAVNISNITKELPVENTKKDETNIKQIKKLETKLKQMETSLSKAITNFATKNGELKQLQAEFNNLVVTSNAENEKLKQQLMIKKEEVQFWKNKAGSLKDKIKQLEAIKDKNSVRINNISTELAKVQRKVVNIRKEKQKNIAKLLVKESALITEKKQLEQANKETNEHLLKLNQQLAAQLTDYQTKNENLISEINNLKLEKVKLENIQAENVKKIKAKTESILLLENRLTVNTDQKNSKEIKKILRQKNKLIAEKKQLEQIVSVSNQQLTNLIFALSQTSERLLQLESSMSWYDDQSLVALTNNYDINPCIAINPIFQEKLTPGPELVVKESILVETGKEFVVSTATWEQVHIGDELVPGVYLQPKPLTF